MTYFMQHSQKFLQFVISSTLGYSLSLVLLEFVALEHKQ